MLKKLNLSSRLTFILKCLLISYLLTTGLLLLLALMLYRFDLSEKTVSICIIGIYIIITFLAGFLAGKREGSRKFLWGLLMGGLYFTILIVISLIINQGMNEVSGNFFTVLVLCCGSGMLGGMLSLQNKEPVHPPIHAPAPTHKHSPFTLPVSRSFPVSTLIYPVRVPSVQD